jgi:hypothetical protein
VNASHEPGGFIKSSDYIQSKPPDREIRRKDDYRSPRRNDKHENTTYEMMNASYRSMRLSVESVICTFPAPSQASPISSPIATTSYESLLFVNTSKYRHLSVRSMLHFVLGLLNEIPIVKKACQLWSHSRFQSSENKRKRRTLRSSPRPCLMPRLVGPSQPLGSLT